MAMAVAAAATGVCDVVGMYVGRDRLRTNGELELLRVLNADVVSVVSLISFDCVGFGFFCAAVVGRRYPGRNCGRTYRIKTTKIVQKIIISLIYILCDRNLSLSNRTVCQDFQHFIWI